jgi:hypothetical protein
VPIDPKNYPIAEQPWSYDQVAGVMEVWEYTPVGDHTLSARENPDAFLKWEKVESDGKTSAFVISSPKWSARGSSQLYWPSELIVEALTDQAVLHRTGLISIKEKIIKTPLQRSGPTKVVKKSAG